MQTELTFSLRDEFRRRTIAENIIKLLKPETELSPLVIDGDWGTGKTEFSIKLKNLISEQEPESRVIYIDAFKGDHAESPLLLITSAIASILPKGQRAKFIKNALPAIRFGLKTAIKAGAGWILRQETDILAEEFQDAIKKASNAAIDGTVENILEDHIEAEKNINSLKLCIEEIANKNKTVIIIDELDRCRPNFSTSILETIKHIFDTKNVFFILITNTTQLKASINHTYGYSIDSQKYLDKFIKYTITLPDTFKNDTQETRRASVEYWVQLSQQNDSLKLIQECASKEVSELIERTNLSLRETQTFARSLYIFQQLNDNILHSKTYYIFKLIFLAAVFMHCFGDKKNLQGDLNTELIDSIARTFNITEIPYDTESPYKVSKFIFIFYGLIKDELHLTSRFSPNEGDDIKSFEEMYSRIEDENLWRTNVKEQINIYMEKMSFIHTN
ncbi:KAP family NTPase [Klebsiella variicola]|uniref:KAP family NTPase n=1 Tax=Klebsiella variicola TaxID=244366 RepID=UPI002B0528D2|nr:P-loop NTPase fold protein [Klebsiella variicola]